MNEPVPKTKEHRLILRAAAEKEFLVTTLRAGLEVFHGWVDMDFDSRVSLEMVVSSNHRNRQLPVGRGDILRRVLQGPRPCWSNLI